jgi:hypothetical protein
MLCAKGLNKPELNKYKRNVTAVDDTVYWYA